MPAGFSKANLNHINTVATENMFKKFTVKTSKKRERNWSGSLVGWKSQLKLFVFSKDEGSYHVWWLKEEDSDVRRTSMRSSSE